MIENGVVLMLEKLFQISSSGFKENRKSLTQSSEFNINNVFHNKALSLLNSFGG